MSEESPWRKSLRLAAVWNDCCDPLHGVAGRRPDADTGKGGLTNWAMSSSCKPLVHIEGKR